MRLFDRHFRRTHALPLVALLAQGLLSACSPRYDWRELRPQGAGWAASFPARVDSASRTIRLDGIGPASLDLTMSMHAARVGGVSFAIGAAMFPTILPATGPVAVDLPDTGDAARRALRAAMLRNIGGVVTHEAPAKLARTHKNLPPIDALALEASGSAAAERVRLAALFAVAPSPAPASAEAAPRQRVVQVVVLGPEAELNSARGREAVETFLTSVRLD